MTNHEWLCQVPIEQFIEIVGVEKCPPDYRTSCHPIPDEHCNSIHRKCHYCWSTWLNAERGDVNINAIPSADVVEVVRCKDCKYFRKRDIFFWHNGKEYGGGLCYKNEPSGTVYVYLDDYCSDAVRREEEDDG